MDFRETESEGGAEMQLDQDKNRWQSLVNPLKDFSVS